MHKRNQGLSGGQDVLEDPVDEERRQAVRVRDALHRIIGEVEQGTPCTPSDLSVWLRKSGPRVSALFLWMACTAVQRKYRLVGQVPIAQSLQTQRLAVEQYWQAQDFCRGAWHSAREKAPLPMMKGRKRISHYQSRWICSDPDIILCHGAWFSLELGITPWICQQANLRFCWTPAGLARLRFLADCWDAYAQSNFTWDDRLIGLSGFIIHPEYC